MGNKLTLYQACVDALESKIAIAKKSMEEAQESANNETKSSAGDKYETGRAMSQNERDMYAKQLSELQHQYKMLKAIKPEKPFSSVEAGAWVSTETGSFFVAISLGPIKLDGKAVAVISPVSPIAQSLLGKTKGESYQWMGKEIKILGIE